MLVGELTSHLRVRQRAAFSEVSLTFSHEPLDLKCPAPLRVCRRFLRGPLLHGVITIKSASLCQVIRVVCKRRGGVQRGEGVPASAYKEPKPGTGSAEVKDESETERGRRSAGCRSWPRSRAQSAKST